MPGQSAHALGGAACPRLSERVITRKGVSVSRIQACQEALNPICTCALKVVESLCILAPLEVLRLAELRVRSGVPACLACKYMRSITTWRRTNVCSSGVKSRGCRHGLGIVHCDTDDVQPLLCWSSCRLLSLPPLFDSTDTELFQFHFQFNLLSTNKIISCVD